LPTGEAVIAKYIAATGGAAEYDKVLNSIATGRMEMPAQGIKGKITIYQQMPDKQYSVAEIPGIGTIEDGVSGNIAWEKSALQGARLKTGEEKDAAIRAANDETRLMNWKKFYKSVETTGVETVDGKPCYKVVLTPLSGKPETEYYEQASGLLIKSSAVVATPMGDVPVETALSDYRLEGKLLVPHKLKQGAIGQQFEILVDEVKYNTDMPKGRFDPPADVQALINKK
jgi:zinc protease